MDQLDAVLKWFQSFGKKEWNLDDYPIRLRYIEPEEPAPPRWKPLPWCAQVVNWWHMRGDGETREQALAELQRHFDEYRVNHPTLPRPGRGSRPEFEFAPTDGIMANRDTVDDLLRRVIGLDPDECLVTDESSLWDFHGELTNDDYYRKIALVYGVDVSDLERPTLVAIAERIRLHRGV